MPAWTWEGKTPEDIIVESWLDDNGLLTMERFAEITKEYTAYLMIDHVAFYQLQYGSLHNVSIDYEMLSKELYDYLISEEYNPSDNLNKIIENMGKI